MPRKGVMSLVQYFFPSETHHHESVLVSSLLKGSRPSHQIIQHKLKSLKNLDAWIWDHYDKADTDANCILSSFSKSGSKVVSCQGLPLTQAVTERSFLDGNSSDTHMLWINFFRHLWRRVMLTWQYLNTHGPKSLSCPAQTHKEQSVGEGQRLPTNQEWQKHWLQAEETMLESPATVLQQAPPPKEHEHVLT